MVIILRNKVDHRSTGHKSFCVRLVVCSFFVEKVVVIHRGFGSFMFFLLYPSDISFGFDI